MPENKYAKYKMIEFFKSTILNNSIANYIYNAPHTTNSNDIFNAFDTIIINQTYNKMYFIQFCNRKHLSNTIATHNLLTDRDLYIISPQIEYYIVTWDRLSKYAYTRNNYRFQCFQIIIDDANKRIFTKLIYDTINDKQI